MPSILVVDPDRGSCTMLEQALSAAGYEVVTAPSAAFALTMLERERPDAIVTRTELPDLTGAELCAIVRSDPATETVPLALVGPLDVAGVLGQVGQLAPLRRAAAPAPAPAPVVRMDGAEDARALRGSLGVLDLTEVVQAIALSGKTGLLSLALAGGAGRIVFERGRIVHAEAGDETGERAFGGLVARSGTSGTFAFEPCEAEAPAGPRTIDRSVEQLLLTIAADLDEGRLPAAPAAGARAS
jgi:hypothetical protein